MRCQKTNAKIIRTKMRIETSIVFVPKFLSFLQISSKQKSLAINKIENEKNKNNKKKNEKQVKNANNTRKMTKKSKSQSGQPFNATALGSECCSQHACRGLGK